MFVCVFTCIEDFFDTRKIILYQKGLVRTCSCANSLINKVCKIQ